MSKRNRTCNVLIPQWAMCYLVNGDASGISETEKNTVDTWVNQYRAMFTNVYSMDIVSHEGDGFYTKYPEFGKACKVDECDVIITLEDK